MTVLVTGGTGFIGNHIVNNLLKNNHNVIVTGTNEPKARVYDWYNKVTYISLDIHNDLDEFNFEVFKNVERVIHLIWSGLPNYKELFHFEENLMSQYKFIKGLVMSGIKDITMTGTCFEYGMQEGSISADIITDPQNPYGVAKDTLRKFLFLLKSKIDFNLKWIRLFYIFGEGQSEGSIIPLLEKAINDKLDQFNMSGGEQLRDYLDVKIVAQNIIDFSLNKQGSGVYNCCSGVPISIRGLIEEHLKKINKNIKLNLGYYPYPDYEPMAFWGKK